MERRAHGSGTIRQRPDGKWEARYIEGKDPGTGKQIRRSIYGATEKEVRKKLTTATHLLDTGRYVAPQKMTVAIWLNTWLDEYVEPVVKPLTLSSYRNHVNNHIIPAFGSIELQALKAHQIQQLYNSMLRGSKGNKPLSPKTIKSLSALLHKSLGQAVKLGYIIANPVEACELPRVQKKEIQPLEQDKIKEFIVAIEDSYYKNLYSITLFTGMRQGEILGLSWSNVNFDKGQITISQQLQKSKGKGDRIKHAISPLVASKIITSVQSETIIKAFITGQNKTTARISGFASTLEVLVASGTIIEEQAIEVLRMLNATVDAGRGIENEYYIASTKSGKIRTITPAPFVMQTLRQERIKQTENRLKAGQAWSNLYDLIFTNELGGNLAPCTVWKNFKRIAVSIELPNARFHDLRHTYATTSLSNGDDIKTVQTNLGHASASFTLDVYAHSSEKMKQESADRMQSFIMGIKKA